MKANELMIGDWVFNKYINKPMKVYPMMLPQMFRQRPDATTEDYNIFPIPLTDEILRSQRACPSVTQTFTAWLFKQQIKKMDVAPDDYPSWVGGGAWLFFWAKMITIASAVIYFVKAIFF